MLEFKRVQGNVIDRVTDPDGNVFFIYDVPSHWVITQANLTYILYDDGLVELFDGNVSTIIQE